ncbi:MAG: TatD family hydrolase [Gammaproteobacteria bacterium]|nr:TatD family hydrolase [Gammaproteobacteria bacterium]
MSNLELVDIGANLLNGQFRDDLDAVLARARGAGLSHMMVTATNVADSAAAIDLCRGHADLSCTVGVHPHAAAKTLAEGGDWVAHLRALAGQEQTWRCPRPKSGRSPGARVDSGESPAPRSRKIVCAIGEAGLDFYRNFSPPADQRAVFDAQILLAAELGLPLFVHDRDSGGAVYDALMNHAGQLNGVVIHCFTGDEADLRRYLAAGFHIGVTGWVCDRRRGERLRGLIPQIPVDRLLIETDAPFLLPHGAASPTADKRRNEPCLLPFIAGAIAELLDMPAAELARQTAANAKRLFGLR